MKIDTSTPPSLHRLSRGFTLMELLLVLGIIGLLVAGTVGIMRVMGPEGKNIAAQGQIWSIDAQIRLYESRFANLPPSQGGLAKMLDKGLLDQKQIKDPWGNDYIYERPGKRSPKKQFDIYSKGDDGIANTKDDIGNWDPIE